MGGRVSDSTGEQFEPGNVRVDQNHILSVSNFSIIGQVTSAIFISLTLLNFNV